MNAFKRLISWFLIPIGDYCDKCPFHFIDSSKPSQENGYCSYLGKGDWDFNEAVKDKYTEVTFGDGRKEMIKYGDLPPGSLLWDGCKECNKKIESWRIK